MGPGPEKTPCTGSDVSGPVAKEKRSKYGQRLDGRFFLSRNFVLPMAVAVATAAVAAPYE